MSSREVQSGSKTDRQGQRLATKAANGGALPIEYVEYWDQRIREDLNVRIGTFDPKWEQAEQLVRNSEGGFRDGNVAAEFVKTLHSRLINSDFDIIVRSDDSTYVDSAERAEIVASAVARITDVTGVTKDVTTFATWASFGVFELGHPMDPSNHDPWMSYRSPNFERDDPSVTDRWEPVEPEEISTFGGAPDNVLPFDPGGIMPQMGPDDIEQPEPVYKPSFGYPYIKAVDPRLIVMPPNVKDPNNSPYYARLRFMTRGELRMVQGVDVNPDVVGVGQWRDLFDKTQEDGSSILFPELLVLVEVYIKRDRNNPQYNGWFFTYILGHPDRVIYQGFNPHGGMIPFVFLKLSRLKKMYDTTLAHELMKYADLYHVAIQAMMRNLHDLLDDKWFVSPAAGLQADEERKLFSRKYRGPVKVNDPEGVKKAREFEFNADLMRAMAFIKSLAQSTTGQSELDRGIAIKEITARQTQALLDATGVNVEDMAEQLSSAMAEVIMKMMHLAGLYSMAGRSRRFNFGAKFTSFDRGKHDFVTSFTYDVEVIDRGAEFSHEERMVWVQFLRTLQSDTNGLLVPYLDREGITKATLRYFGQGPHLLASRAAGREGQGFNPAEVSQLQPGQSAGLMQGFAGGLPPELQEVAQGQHPERELGSRGVDLGNALRGAMNVGTGSGEQ